MKRIFQIISLVPVIIMLFIIFGFSTENAEKSSFTSEKIVIAVCEVVIQDFDELPEAQSKIIVNDLSHYVRKLAHFSEFALLGLFTSLHIFSLSSCYSEITIPEVLPASWGFTSLVALSDELHQQFVPGRACRASDMMIDSMGSLCGVLFVLLIFAVLLKKSQN